MFYDHRKIEKKAQNAWVKSGIYKVRDKVKRKDLPAGRQENFYHLVMFPYPSGNLHIGHWYNFAPADVYARFKRMSGFNVLSPIGFDAFGLPAENAAIKRKIHPRDWTYKNIAFMRKQLKTMGNIYDWSREIITADPGYYKWTQWMFLYLFNRGLVYRKKAPANWCPSCRTVLANEQVVGGQCERCSSAVIQKEIEQWLFKITDYAERLLGDLNDLDWPEKTKAMQRNWIGRSEGANIKFEVKCQRLNVKYFLDVFTTRLDTIFGCTYLVIAPENPIIENLKLKIENFDEVVRYIETAKKKTDLMRTDLAKEKTGVELKGIKAFNPFNGEEVPVFVADYVLGHYGTGAVMAVPAHDERDFEFARKFQLPIKQVICEFYPEPKCPILENAFEEDGHLVASGAFDGLSSAEAREKMAEWLEKNGAGQKTVNYKLRDWLVSRQRYWGAPIPLVFCEGCKKQVEISNFHPSAGGPISKSIQNSKSKIPNSFSRGELLNPGWIAVLEKSLPVKLPDIKDYLPTDEGRSPLARSEKFVKTKCPKCGGAAKRETDTMDTFVCSSWYYLRYTDPKNLKKFADAKKMKTWLPVKMYVGGAEHSVLHLLYSRFFTKALYDGKFVGFKEPFLSLRHQGTILGSDGQKMSKSRGNVVDPDVLVKEFGVDAVRMHLCFMSEYSQGGPWNPHGILGVSRFLQRAATLISRSQPGKNGKAAGQAGLPAGQAGDKCPDRLLHQTIKKTGEDIENFKFNTAVSGLMILFNEIENRSYLKIKNRKLIIKLLAPFAPHLAEELWRKFGGKKSVHAEKWPAYDKNKIIEENFVLVVQVDGKMRDSLEAPVGISRDEAEKLTIARGNVKKWLEGKEIAKTIFIPGKLINIVTRR
ncbi:MAG: leucine--tRNA ligase [Parcubacteria group bacterium]|nr:leucine--tRNA ligase [Parcubacteria group bacterium]